MSIYNLTGHQKTLNASRQFVGRIGSSATLLDAIKALYPGEAFTDGMRYHTRDIPGEDRASNGGSCRKCQTNPILESVGRGMFRVLGEQRVYPESDATRERSEGLEPVRTVAQWPQPQPTQPRPAPSSPSSADVAERVRAFDQRYGEMDRVLWCLSRAAREHLLRGTPSKVVEAFVWTIKSWWGVVGVEGEIKRLAAEALAADKWAEAQFAEFPELTLDAERLASERVSALVSALKTRGAERREFSLASKVLHWLLPWRIPAYDKNVRRSTSVSTRLADESAYREVVHWEYDAARRLLAEGSNWIGTIPPASPFRALDKYLWWNGGGYTGRARLEPNPWAVVDRLGIPRCTD